MLQKALRVDPPPPTLAAAVVQVGAASIAGLVALAGADLTALQWALLQAAIAVRIATLAGAQTWWLAIHLGFAPAAVVGVSLDLPPLAWAGAFAVVALVYGQTHRTQVPLYLAGERVRNAVAALLPQDRPFAFVDMGCGLGGMLSSLRAVRPAGQFDGVELAWLPYAVARLRGIRKGFWVERRDLMTVDLSRYDFVYAFLSPAPMPQLWAKACREMRPGAILVSVAFPVEGIAASEVLRLSDAARHTLYLYRM